MNRPTDSLNIVFIGQNQVEVRREPIPELGPHQLLIETNCTLVSTGTESIVLGRKFAPGTHWDNWVAYPCYPGYSAVGRVVRIGAEVTEFAVGQRVAARSNHKQFAVAHTSSTYPVPEALSDEEACWVAIASIVQHGVRRAKIEFGETVVVVGLGLLGQLVVQYARAAGAGEVIAIDMAPKRLEMAADHGATHTIQAGALGAAPIVADLTGAAMADLVFDVTGHPAVFAPAQALLRRFGRMVLLGDAGNPEQQTLTHNVVTKDLQILGAHDTAPPAEANLYYRWDKKSMVDLFYKYVSRRQMRVDDLITHRYTPQQAAEAYAMLETNRTEAMGVLFDFRSSNA
jgi:2-desacetyl-2-hydroxyethyl bacteriochlorophyllide A dehydrogenase